MVGWLIVNAFLNQQKYYEVYNFLLNSAKKFKIKLELKTNSDLINYDGKTVDFVIFWDKDTRYARMLENAGIRVFNSSDAIEICDDKSLTYLHLKNKFLMPKTVIAPKTFPNIGYTNFDFLKNIDIPYPIVIKECFGSFGAQVYLAHDYNQLFEIVQNIGAKPMLFQELIKTSVGRDIRINIVGNKVVASMMRYSENGDFRANISNGGKMKPYTPTTCETELAVNACKEIGLDFGGVDLLFSDDKPILCEVNSNSHFKNIYDCTGIDVSEHIINYIIKELS